MAKRKAVATFNSMPVSITERNDKLAIQIPTSLSEGWNPATPILIKKVGDTLKIKRNTGDDEIKGAKFSHIIIEHNFADALGWDKGTTLLFTLDDDTITLKEPEGLDYCLENLIESFLFVRLMAGEGAIAAIEYLGSQVNKTFSTTQVTRWRAGGAIPNDAINMMTRTVMDAAVTWEFEPKDLPVLQRGISLCEKEN